MTGVPMGLRLALGGDRSAQTRLLLMTGGVAIAVALLLGVAGVAPAAVERLERASGRHLTFDSPDGTRTQGVRASTSVGYWRGQEVRVLVVEVVGAPVQAPAGLARIPGPGQVMVSPALSDALAGPHGAELAPRLHGTVAGGIGPGGLVGPDELFAVAGAPAGVLRGDLSSGFAAPRGPQVFTSSGEGTETVIVGMQVSDEVRVVTLVAAVGLVVPLIVLVTTASRLSAASRERRAAALRLVGATAGQVRALGAIEGAVVGLLGSAAGAALFLALRVPVATVVPIRSGLFPGDVQPSVLVALVILGGVPVLTAVSGALALRRAVSSPLGVTRQSTAAPAGFVRLLPLGLGMAALGGALANRDAVLAGRWHGTLLLLGGAVLCLLGLAVAGPALARAAGQLLARFGPGPASQLAGRRLIMSPGDSARTVTGTTLVVVVVGWVLAFLPLLAASNPAGRGELATTLQPATVVAGDYSGDADLAAAVPSLEAVPGSGNVVPVRFAQLLRPGATPPAAWTPEDELDPSQFPLQGVVVDCAALSTLLRSPLTDCRPDTIYRMSGTTVASEGLPAANYTILDRQGQPTAQHLRLAQDVPVLAIPDGLVQGIDGFGLQGDLLVPPSMITDADRPDAVLVGTDGRTATIEAVRAALGPVRTPFAAVTAEEATQIARSSTDSYAHAALLGLTLVVLVGGLSVAVTTSDSLRERRRALAALTAIGTPTRVLRRSVLLQTALPLLLGVGLALLVAAAASWLYLRLGASIDTPAPPLPWAGYGAVGTSAIIASLLATAAALPFIQGATRPDALRAE